MSDDELADLDELITRAEKQRLRIIHDHVMVGITLEQTGIAVCVEARWLRDACWP
jgi:hypothetical protein